MKVLIIGNVPLDLLSTKGGVESAIINLLDGFKKTDEIHVKIVSFGKKIDASNCLQLSDKIEICHFHASRIELFSILFNEKSRIKRIIREFVPDIIHFQGSGPHLLSLLGINRAKVVITLHGVLKEELKHQNTLINRIKFIFKSLIDKYYLKGFRNFIFISEYNRSQITFRRSAETVIPNAINSRFFAIPPKQYFSARLIYTGAINQRKNLMLVLKAMKELKKRGKAFTLEVVGGTKEPDYKIQIDNYIIKNNLSNDVRFYGWLSQLEIGNMLHQADILVLPSRQESLPVSIAEAMAAGKVVVATKVGGVAEMITHGESGFLFESDNEIQLTEILEELFDTPEIIGRIATNAIRIANENYNSESVAIKTVRFYDTLL